MITKYYNFDKLFSYNATFNAVCGGRGMGKTFGSKKKAINSALRGIVIKDVPTEVNAQGRNKTKIIQVPTVKSTPEQFIYLRRYKEELELAKATFFSDIEYLWPKWEFRVTKWEAQASPMKYEGIKNRPWVTIGYFVSLSVARNFKSVQFPNVGTIIFDEFIIEKGGQYLPAEPTKLVNFYNTVSRYRPSVRVLMLANAVEITNPYFIHYKVRPNESDDNNFIFMVKKSNGVYYMLWHFPESKEFEAEVDATEFGFFIRQTDPTYADYAVSNIFSDNHDSMIGHKTTTATYIYTLESRSGIFSVWYDAKQDKFYCQEKRPAGDEDFVTLVDEWMSEGKRLARFTDKTMGMLRSAYSHDRMRFDRPATRNAFVEVFKR